MYRLWKVSLSEKFHVQYWIKISILYNYISTQWRIDLSRHDGEMCTIVVPCTSSHATCCIDGTCLSVTLGFILKVPNPNPPIYEDCVRDIGNTYYKNWICSSIDRHTMDLPQLLILNWEWPSSIKTAKPLRRYRWGLQNCSSQQPHNTYHVPLSSINGKCGYKVAIMEPQSFFGSGRQSWG